MESALLVRNQADGERMACSNLFRDAPVTGRRLLLQHHTQERGCCL